MIVKTTLAISAEHPNLPLDTAATFVGSAATFSITGVPTLPAISVAAVAVSVTNASGAVSTVAAVSGEDGWTATFPASHFAAAGTVKDGVVVAVSGTDENGAARTWTAGVGTIVILSSSPVPAPGEVVYNVRLHDAEPDAPTDGDLWPDGEGGYLIYQDGEAHALGGGASITVDDELSETSENPVQNKVVTGAINDAAAEAGSAYAIATGLGGVVDGITAKIPYSASSSNKLVTESDLSSAVAPLEGTSNKVTSLSDSSTDWQYPSAKCVYDALALKADASSLPYALVDVTPTAGAPFVLAACFPITYADNGSTVTITADDANIGILEDGSNGYTIEYNAETIFFCSAEGIYLESVVDGLTFGTNEDTPGSSTPVLGFTPTYALADRTTNQVVVASPLPENGIALAFPEATAGKVRDFLVRLEIPAGDAPQIAYPEGVTFENADGSFPEINTDESAAASTLLMFTETKAATTGAGATPACFLVKGEKLTAIAAGGAA